MKAWVDGATWKANPGPMGVGVHFDTGESLCVPLEWGTNNEAEWHALILAVEHWLTQTDDRKIWIYMDSKNTVEQANRRYLVRAKNLAPLAQHFFYLMKITRKFKRKARIEWVPREENEHADALSKAAASLAGDTVGVGPEANRRAEVKSPRRSGP